MAKLSELDVSVENIREKKRKEKKKKKKKAFGHAIQINRLDPATPLPCRHFLMLHSWAAR